MRSTDAQVEGDRFESPEWRIRISVPEYWRMSAQSSYPGILLWMHRSNPPGKMIFGADRLDAEATPVQYAQQTVARLDGLGYQVQNPQSHAATGAYWIEFDDGKTFFRQALLVFDGIGYSLTLAAPGSRARTQHLRAFDYALRSIQKLEAAQPTAASPPPEAGDTGEADAAVINEGCPRVPADGPADTQ